MAIKKAIFLLLLPLLFPGCGEVDCPAFPEKFQGWFPLDIGSKMVFVNEADSTTFQIKESFRSPSSSFGNNCDCECMASSSFRSDNPSNSGFQIGMGCSFSSESNIIFDLDFKNDTSDDKYNFRYNKNTDIYEHISYTSDYTTDKQTYHKVAVLEKVTGYRSVKKVFVSLDRGLLGFVDKNDKEWKLIE
jgi:hypothetical protein